MPSGLREALAASYAELFAAMVDEPRCAGRLHAAGGARCAVTPGVEDAGWALFFNQVHGLGLERPATEGDVDLALAPYLDPKTPAVVLEADARPPALAGWLRARGLWPGLALARFHRGLDGMEATKPAGPFRVEAVGPATADAFVALAGRGLPPALASGVARLSRRPDWRLSLVMDGDKPVAAGGLFAHAGIGCLCWTATRPDHRRRGAHGLLIGHRARQAAEMGCRLLVSETVETRADGVGPSARNLLRAGFRPAPRAEIYVRAPAS